jgi:hypothetical protein
MNALLAAALLLAQDKNTEQLIEKLRSDKIEVRNDAARELRNLGEAVVPRLEKAAQDVDSELAGFAKQIIRDIKDPLYAETAEETFNKMDEQLRSAKTLKVKFRFDFTRGDKKPDFESKPAPTLMMKGADRICVEPPPATDKEKADLEGAVADGKTVNGQKAYPPKVFRDDIMTGLTRTGVSLALYFGGSARMDGDKVVDARVEDGMELSKATLKGQDTLGRIITYTVTFNDREVVDVTLWCDLKTRLPRKRIASTRGAGQNLQHFCEFYEDWVLNADIPDEKFKLPEKKK